MLIFVIEMMIGSTSCDQVAQVRKQHPWRAQGVKNKEIIADARMQCHYSYVVSLVQSLSFSHDLIRDTCELSVLDNNCIQLAN